MPDRRRGYLSGVGAFVLWGLFPLYWPLLKPASPLEILVHRVIWSVVFVAILIAIRRNWSAIRAVLRSPRSMLILACASMVIAVNWGGYIWAVNNGYVVESALGYFINPLVSVVFGVAFFGERLGWVKWSAVGLATVAVVVLTVDYGRPPWIALVLAFSFGTYGVLKKLVPVGAVPGLAVESGVLALPALVVVILLEVAGTATVGHVSVGHTLLVIAGGIATAVPLLLFAAAAKRLPLSTVGVLQYIGPTLQMVCGLVIFHEPMPPSRWLGFGLVWLALVVFSLDGLRQSRRTAAGDLAPATV